MTQNRFIAGDWGTSRLRLALCQDGEVLARTEAPGIGAGVSPAEVFARATVGWAEEGATPAILSGMVGSTLGWREAGYLDCPTSLNGLAAGLTRFQADGREIAIAPGLACTNRLGAPDVMRGEETQILGAIALRPDLAQGLRLLCLPGTHTKWVLLAEGAVTVFQTALTGELFAALKDHTVLGHGAEGLTPDRGEAFQHGVRRATGTERPSLLHLMFEARSRRLREAMEPGDAVSFLSGLTIGADVAGGLDLFVEAAHAPVTVVGAPRLAEAYRDALLEAGRHAVILDGDETALAGQQSLICAAHMLED